MEQEYFIRSGEETIGMVMVQRQGLYYRICCKSKLTGAVRYKLMVSCGNNTVDLGICVPLEEGFGVNTRIPVKRLGEGPLTFQLTPKHHMLLAQFVPVSNEEPFGYIRYLQNAHLAKQDGRMGIVFTEAQNSRDNPTGQWSEPITSE